MRALRILEYSSVYYRESHGGGTTPVWKVPLEVAGVVGRSRAKTDDEARGWHDYQMRKER